MIQVKTFSFPYLSGTKDTLKSAFYHENSNAVFNEWEFAETLLQSDGYLPELCVIAIDGETVVGYNANGHLL